MHLSFVISHGTPLGGRENGLSGRINLVTENLLDQLRVRADPLEKHEEATGGFLGRILVLHAGFAGFSNLALGGLDCVLPVDILGSEGAHVSRELPLPCDLFGPRHLLVFLDNR